MAKAVNQPAQQRAITRYYFKSALVGPDKFKETKKFPKDAVDTFFQNNAIVRQFYQRPRPKKKSMHAITSQFPLHRLHCDLMDFSFEAAYAPRYGLIVIDCYSRYMIVIPVHQKDAPAMVEAFKQVLSKLSPFRQQHPSMQSSHFMSDAGLEFRAKPVVNYLKAQGHTMSVLKSSLSKAVLAERAIRTYRQKLALLKLKLGAPAYEKGKGWSQFNNTIVTSYNETTHAAFQHQATPTQVMTGTARSWKKPPRFSSFQSFLSLMQRHQALEKTFVGQYCNLVTLPSSLFTKKSARTKLSTEVFVIVNCRFSMADATKDPMLTLHDLTGERIQGLFKTDEIRIIPKQSTQHPEHPDFKFTIAEVVSSRRVGRRTEYRVHLSGKYTPSFDPPSLPPVTAQPPPT